MLHLALRRQTVGERGQKGERVIRVPLVLGQVQRHAADESPLRVALSQIALRTAGVLARSRSGRVHRGLATNSTRTSGVRYSSPVMGGAWRTARSRSAAGGGSSGIGSAGFRDGGVAKVREIEPGDRSGELERTAAAPRPSPRSRRRASRGPGSLAYASRSRFRELPIRGFERRLSNEEMPLRRDRQFVHREATALC